MARKRVTDEERSPSIREVCLGDAEFLTIEEDDAVWEHEGPPNDADAYRFVRIRPPSEATDEHIARVKAFFPKARVRILPRNKPQVVTDQKTVKASTKTIRETVLTMVQEANTVNREALKNLAEATLVRVKL